MCVGGGLDRRHDRVPFVIRLACDRHEIVHAEDRSHAAGREHILGERITGRPFGAGYVERRREVVSNVNFIALGLGVGEGEA